MPTLKESNEFIAMATFKEGRIPVSTLKESNEFIAMATFKGGRAAMATSEESLHLAILFQQSVIL